MIIMSVTCSYVFYVWHFKGDIPISFWFLMRKWLCK